MAEKIGVIEKIEFTRGGFGNQFTTINGHRYWTWWDSCNPAVGLGKRVRFREALNVKVWDSPLTYGDVASHFTTAEETNG